MGDYVPVLSELTGFVIYFIILIILFIFILSWTVDEKKYADVFIYGSIVSAILGCLTVWGMAMTK